MGLTLELRTLVIFGGILLWLISAVMLCVRFIYPPSVKGLDYWVLGNFLVASSLTFFVGRSELPELSPVVLSHSLFYIGVWLHYAGLRRFLGLPILWRRGLAMWLIFILALACLTHVVPDFNQRVVVVNVSLAVLTVMTGRLVLLHAPRRFSSWVVLASLMVLALVSGVRGALALWADLYPQFETPEFVILSYVMVLNFSTVIASFGFTLMAGDRFRELYEHQATHDALTDVLNRRAFFDAVSQELSRSLRNGQTLTLLYLDVDHFKAVNDRYGHQVGDRVLLSLTQRLRQLLRHQDVLARLGGEEFAVLLPETSLVEAETVAQRLLRVASETPQGTDLPRISLSMGVTALQPTDSKVDDLIARADKALYDAKSQGRDRAVIS